MQKLSIVDAETLLYEPLDKPSFVVDGLIPTGLTPVLRLSENRQELAYAEALPVCIAGTSPVGYAHKVWRCFVSLP